MGDRIILSAIIIAKNSEELIEDCLKSLSFCDEILVVDAGSIDKTVPLARRFGARVVKGTDGDFAQQRNIGLKEAKGEWILYIDTDERVSLELRDEITLAINQNAFSAYRLQRKNFYLGNYPWPKIERLERLFRKDNLEGWYGKLHETAKVKGKIANLEGFLLHYTHRDLGSMLSKTILWSQTEARLRLDAHHPKIVGWRLVRVMFTGFIDSYLKQGGWKAGTMGLIESIYQSYSMFITYARLWELQQKSNK
jgi:hypothetical protein